MDRGFGLCSAAVLRATVWPSTGPRPGLVTWAGTPSRPPSTRVRSAPRREGVRIRAAMNRRFALIQAVVSLVALAAVVWWASHQEPPHIPSDGGTIAWIVAAVLLYALATCARAERWHHILRISGVHTERADSYALTTVGYMGNNVLPARAGEMLRVVLLDQRTNAGKRKLM